MAEVRIEHVFKRFGAVTAVNDFDLVVKDGEFVSILGPSGCGKTTTLRMIAGFERATEGEIYIGDHCVSSSIKAASLRRKNVISAWYSSPMQFGRI